MSFIRSIVAKTVSSEMGWKIVKPIVKIGSFLKWKREEVENERTKRKEDCLQSEAANTFNSLFSDLTVLHGPFKGMKYPAFDAVGSGLYPKLIGSYERELSGAFEIICRQDYTEIIDIGCAEGYYAIGCSIRIPSAKVVAYDTSEKARSLCLEMAKLNKVDDKIEIRSSCTPEELENFGFTKRGFIICDCEGYEFQLFNEKNIQNLAKCDLIIEVHDFLNPNISSRLRTLFSDSHELTVIKSTTDDEKAASYQYDEIVNLNGPLKKILFKEGRPGIMEWLLLSSKG